MYKNKLEYPGRIFQLFLQTQSPQGRYGLMISYGYVPYMRIIQFQYLPFSNAV